MLNRTILIVITLLFVFFKTTAQVGIDNIRLNAETINFPISATKNVTQYNKVEINFDISGVVPTNNFDDEIIKVDALITLPGTTTEIEHPCFFYVPCIYNFNGITTQASNWNQPPPSINLNYSNKKWLFRFTPTIVGVYKFRIRVRLNNSTTNAAISSNRFLNVQTNNNITNRFVKINPTTKQFFFDGNNVTYNPVGTNLLWQDNNFTSFFNNYFSNIPNNSMNWTRYWFVQFRNQALEWSGGDINIPTDPTRYSYWSWYDSDNTTSPVSPNEKNGMGYYNQKSAALFEYFLDQCSAKGIYVQPVLQMFDQFKTNAENGYWDLYINPSNNLCENAGHPYKDKILGGVTIDSPSKFFTSAGAKKQSKKLYRYIVARWGYSPNILAWELFNEIDFSGIAKSDYSPWHNEMSTYIKGIDMHKYLITTSCGTDASSLSDMIAYPNMDMLQPHVYLCGTLDDVVLNSSNTYAANNSTSNPNGLGPKPTMIGEFGIEGNGNLDQMYANLRDEEGDHLRKSMWLNMMNRRPVQFWSWEYIANKNLYTVFKPIADFLPKVDMSSATNAVLTFSDNSSTVFLLPSLSFPTFNNTNTGTLSCTIDGSGNSTNANILRNLLDDTKSIQFGATFNAGGRASITVYGSNSTTKNLLIDYIVGGTTNTITYPIPPNGGGTFTSSYINSGACTIKFRCTGGQVYIKNYSFNGVNLTTPPSITISPNNFMPYLANSTPNPWVGNVLANESSTNAHCLNGYLRGTLNGNTDREASFTATFGSNTTLNMATINISQVAPGGGPRLLEIYVGSTLVGGTQTVGTSGGTFTILGSQIGTGTKTIKFKSVGTDWLLVSNYKFGGVQRNTPVTYGGKGFRLGNDIYGYVYDKSYGDWALGIPPCTGASVGLSGLTTSATYVVEYFDPKGGAPLNLPSQGTNSFSTTNTETTKTINLPPFTKDIAFKVKRTNPPPPIMAHKTTGKLTMNLYPSLSQNNITVELYYAKGKQNLKIVDIIGRTWFNTNVTPSDGTYNNTFDISYLPNGMYFMVALSDESSITKKFLKQ